VTLFAAGAETTALGLTYSLVLLGQNPAARARLEAELDATLGGRAPTMSDLRQMPYLDAVVSESLRIYTPAWGVGRRAIRDFVLGPWQVRRDDTLLIMPWALHRDARHFPDPESFKPERWLGGLDKRLPRYAYMPFGAGPRVCVGSHFARMELMLVLSVLLQRYRFDVGPDLVLELEPSVTLRPTGPVPFYISPRATVVGQDNRRLP
jgi:cytochrome P450